MPRDILVENKKGICITLDRKQLDKVEETLRFFLAIDGNDEKEKAKLLKLAKEFANCKRIGLIS